MVMKRVAFFLIAVVVLSAYGSARAATPPRILNDGFKGNKSGCNGVTPCAWSIAYDGPSDVSTVTANWAGTPYTWTFNHATGAGAGWATVIKVGLKTGSGVTITYATEGVALPMNTAGVTLTAFSPIPYMAYANPTPMVRIRVKNTGRTIDAPLIDNGPQLQVGKGIDLAPKTAELLGLSPTNTLAEVSFQILDWQVGNPCVGNGVYVYYDADQRGTCTRFTSNSAWPNAYWTLGNDQASSISFMGSGWGATLYEHGLYGGVFTNFTQANPNFSGTTIGHDSASSIRVHRFYDCSVGGEGVYLYDGSNFTGACTKFEYSSYPYTWQVGNDRASSIKIVGRWAVAVCEHADFAGRCEFYKSTNVVLSGSMDNNVSSVMAHALP